MVDWPSASSPDRRGVRPDRRSGQQHVLVGEVGVEVVGRAATAAAPSRVGRDRASTAAASSSPISASIARSRWCWRVVAAIAGVRGEPDQTLRLQRGERVGRRAAGRRRAGSRSTACQSARSGRAGHPRHEPIEIGDRCDRQGAWRSIGHDGRGDRTTPARPASGCSTSRRVLSGPHCRTDAHRPRRRGDQDRAAGGRPDPLRHAAPQRPVELLRAAERRQAQHQPRPRRPIAGVEILLDLAEHADVLVENYRPGVMDRLGLGADALRAINPRLIYASISGYGQTGPWVRRRAYAPVVEAEAGIIASQGNARGGPLTQGSAQPRRRLHRDRGGLGDPRRAVPTRAHRTWARRSTCRWPRRCSTSTNTCTTRCGTATTTRSWIRSFRPGDYLVLTVANGESLVVSAAIPPNAARSTSSSPRWAGPTSSTIPASPTSPAGSPTSTRSSTSSATSPPVCPTPTRSRRSSPHHQLAVGQVRQPGELADDRVGGRTRRGGRHRRPRRRLDPRAERPVAFQRRARRRRRRRRRSTAARTTAPCSPTSSATTTRTLDDLEADGVLSSRSAAPAGRDRRELQFPVAADEGDDGLAARRATTGRSRSSGTATARSSTSPTARCACRAPPATT